jgi:cysteine-rich repeat protein
VTVTICKADGTCPGQSTASCGNSQVDSSEVCDDGNTTNGDGCDSTCKQEVGFVCVNTAGSKSVCQQNTVATATTQAVSTSTDTAIAVGGSQQTATGVSSISLAAITVPSAAVGTGKAISATAQVSAAAPSAAEAATQLDAVKSQGASPQSSTVVITVVPAIAAGQKIDPPVEVCLTPTDATADLSTGACLAFFDTATNQWTCASGGSSLTKKGDQWCGTTDHFTPFSLLSGLSTATATPTPTSSTSTSGSPTATTDDGLSDGATAGIVVGAVAFVVIVGVVGYFVTKKPSGASDPELGRRSPGISAQSSSLDISYGDTSVSGTTGLSYSVSDSETSVASSVSSEDGGFTMSSDDASTMF